MAAIYSGIHLKLKSPHTPWEDKLKLARFAWLSSHCLLPNKEQVLLDWCTHALTGWYNQKVKFSTDVLEGLWCYLEDLLQSKKLHTALKQGKTISLRLNLVQLLLDRLQVCSDSAQPPPECVSTILRVCQRVLLSPSLSSVFTTKYELMVSLLVKVCNLACSEMQKPKLTGCGQPDVTDPDSKPNRTACSADPFELLLQVLSSYLSVQRQQANQNRVFTSVTNQLFQLLVLLRHLMTSGELPMTHPHLRTRQQLSRDIRVKIDLIIQSALFPAEHLTYYKEELFLPAQGPGKRGPVGAKGPLKPVTAIMSKLTAAGGLDPSLYYTVKSSTVALLFKFFMENYRKGRKEGDEEQGMLCFYFLSRLITALDVGINTAPPAKAVQHKSPDSWSLALLAVESMLTIALSENIYNIAADRIRHKEIQLKFYQSVAQILLNQAQPSIPAWYRCLKVLLNLNHLILEPDLDLLLSLAWVDAECAEARAHRAQQLLLCSLIQIYSKLRQLPRFFSELLSVICQSTVDQKQRSLLSDEVSASLRTCVQDTPASLGLEMCSLVLESIKNSLLPELAEEGGATEKMEVDGSGGGKEAAARKLCSLSQLLHVVLLSLKTLDNASPLPLVRRCESLMKEMQQTIQNLLTLLSSQNKDAKTKGKKNRNSKEGEMWEEKTQEAALFLKYTWMEVDTLFGFHCTKYSSADQTTTQCVTKEHSEDDDVSLLPVLIPTTLSSFSSLQLKLLTLQQMKKAMLEGPLGADESTASLTKAAQFILAKDELEESLNGGAFWDGQISSVTDESYRVAHWYVVTSNLPLIAPHLSGNDLCSIANFLIRSLLSSTADGVKDPPPGCLTVTRISAQLLKSSIFDELPLLFSTFLSALAQRICLTSGKTSKLCSSLTKFEEALKSADSEMDGGQLLSSLVHNETVVEDILKSRNSQAFVTLTEFQTEELTKLLQIINQLNPDVISSQDLTSIFLLLLFVLTCTSTDDTAFVVKLLRVLHLLLEAKNFQSVLKLIHGGSLLETVVSSLLSHKRANFTASSDWLDVISTLQALITSLIQLIIVRNSSVRLNLDQFASFLASKDLSRRSDLHILLASLTSFSQAMVSNLGKSKVVDPTLIQTLKRATSVIGPALESLLTPPAFSQGEIQPSCTPSQTFLVEVVNVMLHCEISSLSVEEEKNEDQLELSHMTLYQNFYKKILNEIKSDAEPVDFYSSCLRFLSLFYAAVEKTVRRKEEKEKEEELDELFLQILQNMNILLSAPGLSSSDLGQLEAAVQELLRLLVGNSSASRFILLLQMIKGGLDPGKLQSGNYREVLSAVIIIKLLSRCQLPDGCSRALWHIAPQILSAMVFLVTSSSQELSLTLPFTIPVVTSMTSLLRQGEGLLTNSHHVILVLGALHSVPLDRLTPLIYQSAFMAVHEGLFAIIQCHPKVISKAAPSFLNVFYRLAASIMQEGRQRGDTDPGADGDVYLQCSRLIERMYSHIAAIPETFSCQPVFMVAQYVTDLQKVTLRPDVKLHLTEGIYCILDLCMEQDIKFLTAGLQAGVREVFNELYGSYTHYHKAQRQGEEKYTV